MCGIVGFTGSQAEDVYIDEMNNTQLHRGPDDGGKFFCQQQGVHIAMRRLSIIDVDGGHQPMSSPDKKFWVVFNGEIFNAALLRKELEIKGVKFITDHSDTEVLLQLYIKYGADMLIKLNGMFAFVIYDIEKAKLFCARDMFGIKPFYYSTANERFSFASELKSLRKLPWVSEDLNYQSIYHYFSFQSVPAPNSILKSIQKLPAAHWLEWDIKTKSIGKGCYWKPEFGSTLPCAKNELPDYILGSFRYAVDRWSISDVPIACSLSGGVDSSSIVALLDELGHKSVNTYTLGFDDMPKLDERDLAYKVAKRYNTNHHEIVLSSSELHDELDLMLSSLDEPYAGGLPSWFVFKAMSQDVKVGMSGTGGDELFGNYGKWSVYSNPTDFVLSLYRYFQHGGGISDLLKNTKASLYHPNYFTDYMKENHFFCEDFITEIRQRSLDIIQELWDNSISHRDIIPKIDLSLQLPEEFLLMTDRFSMAHSLEVRTPFLDKDFVNDIYAVPAKYRTQRGNIKHLFKDAVKEYMPSELLTAKKRGFVLPQARWLRGVLSEDINNLSDDLFIKKQGIFNSNIRKNFILPFLAGRTNNSDQVWTWLMFQKFYLLQGRSF